MKRYDLDQGTDYHPAATMVESFEGYWVEADEALAEIKRLEDHLHGCREQREAAEAVETKAQDEVVRLRAAMEDAARILVNIEEQPTPNVKLMNDAWVVLRTALGYKP